MSKKRNSIRCCCTPYKGLSCKACYGKHARKSAPVNLKPGDKNWKVNCEVCGASPTVHPTGLCGPCAFGEADTMGGNW